MKAIFKTSNRNLGLIGLASVILAGFGIISAYPDYCRIKQNKRELARLKATVKEQAVLFSLYKTINTRIQKRADLEFPVPEKTVLPAGELPGLSIRFKEIAAKNGFSLKQCQVSLESVKQESPGVPVKLVLEGRYPDFRNLLLDMAGLGFLSGLNEMEIRADRESREYMLSFSIYIR